MSEVSRRRLIEVGIPKEKIHVVPYGVDVPREAQIRSPDSTIRCLAAGRMVSKKGPLKTLEAFHLAVQKIPELKLDFIGEGPLFQKAKNLVQDLNLEGKITFLGSQPNSVVQKKMQQSDIFVQHSMIDPETGDEEGLPVAILEAMSYALPVVATKHAGIQEAVLDQQTGYLVQEGEVHEMAEYIKLLAQKPALRIEMGHAAWSRAKQLFSWERERSSLLKILSIDESNASTSS
jgi:glycosyltransferase involved in cell wall biosynthesis